MLRHSWLRPHPRIPDTRTLGWRRRRVSDVVPDDDKPMKNIPLLLILLVAIPGCADSPDGDIVIPDLSEYTDPRIVSIDPPLQEIDQDLVGSRDNNVVLLHREGFQTITITFSSPPLNVRMDWILWSRRPKDYIVDSTKVIVTVYCTINEQGNYITLPIEWGEDSSETIPLYCPFGD